MHLNNHTIEFDSKFPVPIQPGGFTLQQTIHCPACVSPMLSVSGSDATPSQYKLISTCYAHAPTKLACLDALTLTAYGSHTPSSFMSTISPVFPFSPKVQSELSACFALSLVSVLMTLAPQFWARVRGMTSRAVPTAL